MAKCSRCGRGGLFFKVNTNGRCKECERIEELEQEATALKKEIDSLKTESQSLQKIIDDIGARDAITVQAKISEYRQTETSLKISCDGIRSAIDGLQKEVSQKKE